MAVLKNVVSKIFNLSTTPAKKTEGQFWYDTTNNVLKRSDGSDYKPLAVGDNLISAGSTDTVKGILDSKANASDLTNYLKKTGDNSLVLGNYENGIEGTIFLNSEYDEFFYTKITGTNGIEIGSDVGRIWLDPSGYGIRFGESSNIHDADFIVGFNGISGHYIDNNLANELEDGHIATSKAIKSYVDTSVLNKANASDVVTLTGYQTISGSKIFTDNITFVNGNVESIHIDASNIKFTGEDIEFDVNAYDGIHMRHVGGYSTDITSYSILSQNNSGTSIISGGTQVTVTNTYRDEISQLTGIHNFNETAFIGYSIGTGLDLESEDQSNFKNNTIFSVGYSVDLTTDINTAEFIPEISGSLVDKTISSSSLDTHIPTSKAVYTSLANKQDKMIYVEEDASIGNLYLGVISSSNAYITLAQDGGTMEISGISLDITSLNPIKINSDDGFAGSAIVSTLGTSTTSSKLPTEGAVVKAISDVKTSLGSALTYEGSVENYSNLPTGLTASDKGKVYNVVNANGNIPAGTNYAWNGTSWDALGGELSAYQLKTDTTLELGSSIDDETGYTMIPGKITVNGEYHGQYTEITKDQIALESDIGSTLINGGRLYLNDRRGTNVTFIIDDGIGGTLVDTLIPSTPEDGHIATTGAIKTYVDNSTSNKVEKNS